MISADTLIDRMIFMGIGCVLGLILGWTSRAMKYAREARNDSHIAREKVEQIVDEHEESGKIDANSVALISVILLVSFSAFISGLSAARVGSAQDSIRQSQKCTESILADVTRTLKERTSFTSEISRADKRQNEAFLKIASLSLNTKNPPTKEESIRVVTEYRDALDKYLDLLGESEKTKGQNPYPEASDYRNCLDQVDD